METHNNNYHGDILVLPFFGQGHLFPCTELCKHLSSHNYNSILIIPSHLSSSIPSTLHDHPLLHVLQIPPPSPKHEDNPNPVHHHRYPHQDLGQGIESFLSSRYKDYSQSRPLCVIMDVMMSWSKEIFKREEIPVVTFFTSGACSTALEYATWKDNVAENMSPGETKPLPGLPESLSLSYTDLKRKDRRRGPVRPRGGMDWGPPQPGERPKWLDESEGSSALLINTCYDLEGPFLEYLSEQVRKPVLGVGPLLPESYFEPTGSVLSDRKTRPDKESNYTEDEVTKWLDAKPNRSVIYVSFGSEVGPTLEEYDQLADALRESTRSFIWVIQPGSGKPGPPPNFFRAAPTSGPDRGGEGSSGYYPHGLEQEVGDRVLIIKGWAPQLLILSHPSTGAFLSHCGWNSTVEAIGRGVPILAWPVRGDQFYNAKLLVKHLRTGHLVTSGGDFSEMVKKSDIIEGIDKVMEDKDVQERAVKLTSVFEAGFPSSSTDSFMALTGLFSK